MKAKQIRNMVEAYASMYSQVIVEAECESEEEETEEEETPKMNGKKKEKKEKEEKEDEMKEGVDLFDYLLEYLVAEGYADTNKAALAIMANMGEEWKQSIVEQMNSGSTDSSSDENKSFTGEGPKNPKGWKPTGPKLKTGQRPGYAR